MKDTCTRDKEKEKCRKVNKSEIEGGQNPEMSRDGEKE